MTNKPLFIQFRNFTGINNIKEPWELQPSELMVARNVEIDNAGRIARRGGMTRIMEGNFHSLYADGSIFLAVRDGDLVRLFIDDAASEVLRSDVGDSPMSYTTVNDIIVYTNGDVIGYVKNGESYLFDEPNEQYKRRLPPGHLIEHFYNRLYIVRDNWFLWSDPLAYRLAYDARSSYKAMPSRITLFKGVDDGVFISDEQYIYFAAGLDANDWNQPGALRRVYDQPAYYNAWCELGDVVIGDALITGKTFAITTVDGVCVIASGGLIRNLTKDFYRMPPSRRVAMLYREKRNVHQIIVSFIN